jgi:hypothetical protein
MRSRRLAVPLAAAAALLAAAPSARAQTVTGRLVDPSGVPVERVLVVLVDSAGAQGGGAITDASGGFTIRAHGPGRYALRAERIGFATVSSPQFDLASGETREQRLVASGSAVALAAVTVTPQARRCAVRPREGLATATLWEEARKALNATAFAQHQRLFRYDLVRWERDLDPGTLAVRGDRRVHDSGVYHLPFVSAPPAELAREGYVRVAPGDTLVYYAPDADVLLSDDFLDGHCFRVAENGADSTLVGLEFQPAGGRHGADVRGVLWLERGTSRLRRLEYTYVNGPEAARLPGVGGTVEFTALPDGPWIVGRWSIRMPIAREVRQVSVQMGVRAPVVRDRGATNEVELIREAGGEVTGAVGGDARAVALSSAPPAYVQGVAWDSTRNAPLAGAHVFLSGTGAEAVADSDGRFRIRAPVAGSYTLAFADSSLGPLLAAVPRPQVRLEPDRTVTADLAVPSPRTLARTVCPAATLRSNAGIVLGRATGVAPGTEVWGLWSRYNVQAGRVLTGGADWARTVPDASGWFVLCGVSEDRPVTLSLRQGRHVLGQVEVNVTGLLRQDLDRATLADTAPR